MPMKYNRRILKINKNKNLYSNRSFNIQINNFHLKINLFN